MDRRNIVIAAGLHKDVKDKYFRGKSHKSHHLQVPMKLTALKPSVGHMGVSVVEQQRGDIDKVITGIKEAFEEAGYKAPSGQSS